MDRRRDSTPGDEETKVVAPRFDERESATARPVVPIDSRGGAADGKRATVRPSLTTLSRYLILAWAVCATLAAGVFAIYRNNETSAQQIAVPQPSPEITVEKAAVTPQPAARRDVPVAPARRAGVTEVRSLLPSRVEPDWRTGEDGERDDVDEEELAERARKAEKRRRKEEEKRREEAEEAEEDAERALKEARKKAERLRDKQKDEGRKSRLVGVISNKSGT
jgi:type IV secretory pathway VirB10-like protein